MMTCGRCGKVNGDDAVYCEECGAELGEYDESQGNTLLTVVLVCIIAAIALMAGIILENRFLF